MSGQLLESFGAVGFPWYGKLVLWVLLTLILSMSSCTVLTSFDDGEEARYRAEETKAESVAESAQAVSNVAMEKIRLETLERLIKEHNFGPVSARCAVEGWSTTDRGICTEANALHEASK